MTGERARNVDFDAVLALEVAAFYALEARLLDGERYPEWLELLTADVHYWIPGVENRYRADRTCSYSADHMAYFDDTLEDLRMRVARFQSGAAFAEDPPTRHVHVVSNVEVEATPDPQELVAHSVVIDYRNRGDQVGDTLYGRREDRLRRVDGNLLIARRRVVLAHSVLPSKNLNTFL
ncbi:MAG: aromatic-ring-hydroxylating dioxygenase beta subunit [Actinomycetia bacterium]|nr:aromatic-ring-hydroxylating dioxygenase beta subunit [Actinomycetes bacterium]